MAFGDVVQVAHNQVSTAGSITVTPPANPTNGNLVVLSHGTGATTAALSPVPAGFTLIDHTRGTTRRQRYYYKVADSEPSSYTWVVDGGTMTQSAAMAEFEFGGAILLQDTQARDDSGTTVFNGTHTITADPVLLVYGVTFGLAGNTIGSWTHSLVERVETAAGSPASNSAIASKVISATEYAGDATLASSTTWVSIAASFAADAAGGGLSRIVGSVVTGSLVDSV